MTMGLNTKPATTRRCALEDRDGRVLMTGLVDAIDLDGLVYFRLGTDCLIMLEAAPGQFEVGSWLDLDLDAASVVAYL
ncbi:MAG: hypothetical protein DRJ42_02575 [Deltaproteobacteria bacterium]|nr:MAG: hypothetical protein DRJ42_02575 [Deltaproteobacteria bacterium]